MHTDHHRFTDRARKIMQLANQEALQLRHEYIGTEHLLIALAKEDTGVAAAVVRNLGLDLARARRDVERLLEPGPSAVAAKSVPLTPRAQNVIEYAFEEAAALNHEYVGSEHLLLGLLRERDGLASLVLSNMGITPDAVRIALAELLGPVTGNPELLMVSGKPLVAAAPVHWKTGEPPLPPPPEFLVAENSSPIRPLILALLLVSLAANLVLGVILYLAFTVR
jgi:hypothetical protein